MARNKAKKGKNKSSFDCGNNLPDFNSITPPLDFGAGLPELPDYPTLPDDLWQRGDDDSIWDDLPEMDWDFPPIDWDFPPVDWDFPLVDWDFPEIDWNLSEIDWDNLPDIYWDLPEIDLGGTVDNNSEKKTQKQRKRPKAGNGGEPPKTGEKTAQNKRKKP